MDSDAFGRLMLLCVLAGIFVLFLALEFIPPLDVSQGSLPPASAGGVVRVEGTVLSVHTSASVSMLTVGQYCEVQAVMFGDGQFSPQNGQQLSIVGRVQEYKGRRELVADEVKRTG